MLPNMKSSNGSPVPFTKQNHYQDDDDNDNGKQSRSSSWYRNRILLLCCRKELLCYYIGFWLLITLSIVGWTRTNFITTIINSNIQLSTILQQQSESTRDGNTYRTKQQRKNDQSLPGYRFVLNQTAEDIRIRTQYAAKSEIPLCRRYQITAGQWLSVQYEKPPYVTSVKHLRCYPPDLYRQSPWNTYTWMPDMAAVGACTFDEYSTNDLCTLLPRGTISIIGDSLSWEQYRSIIELHNVPTRQGYQFQSYELNMNIQQSICDGGITSVVYRRDDYLQNVEQSIKDNFPTVLILNRGAHYVPDDQLVSDMKALIKVIRKWLHTCEDDYKMECHFFWRTTVPGHVGCNVTGIKIDTPVYDIHDIEKRLIRNKSLYNDVSIEYHWYDFQHQNEIVLDLFRKAKLSNFQVIDAYYLNVLRPDEHRAHTGDCLHSCYPGKMDVYNRLLLHYLKMQRSSNDIKRLQAVATANDWSININTLYDEEATNKARDQRIANELAALKELEKESTETASHTDKATLVGQKSKESTSKSNTKDDEEKALKKKDKDNGDDEEDEDEDDDNDADENDSDDQVDEGENGEEEEEEEDEDESDDNDEDGNDSDESDDKKGDGDSSSKESE